jgi:AraC-like DNA-binding protein
VDPLGPGERIEWGRSQDLPGTQVLIVDNCARRWKMFHTTYTVCTGLSIGRPAEWAYRGRNHLQTADGLMLIEPGEVHANTRITDPASFRVLLVDPQLVARLAAELGTGVKQPHLRTAQLHGGPVHRAFVALHAALENGATTLERQTRFAACARMLLEQCTEKPAAQLASRRDRPAMRRAREYIDAHYAEAVTLDDVLAAAGSVSRFHLVRAFAKEYGLPPHAYQLQVRMARARAMLAARMRAADVAASLGFADQSHFTRHFRAILGVTPSVYARQVASQDRRAVASSL